MNFQSRVLSFLLVVTVGCVTTHEPPPPTAHAWLQRAEDGVRRIALLPLAEMSGVEGATPKLEPYLASELRKTGMLDVVVAPPDLEAAASLSAGYASGNYETDRLIEIRNRFHADAALVGVITLRHGYPPFALGVRADLVSLTTGAVLWAMDGTFDASDEATVNALREDYAEASPADDALDSVYDFTVCFVSRERFAQFVCRRIAHALTGPTAIRRPVIEYE
ncbi:MAG: hypothetical protein HYR85_06340 [Planctomycetes bacterium]|nr:hypothetical protein [Planctomycetota bacterium]MBI3843048.1 hypothetical protein [Planctomycetota bacterium]